MFAMMIKGAVSKGVVRGVGQRGASALSRVAFKQFFFDGVDGAFFFHRPSRGDQEVGGAVGGEALYDDVGREEFQIVANEGDVFFEFEDRDFAAGVGVGERGVFEDVEEMDFDAVNAEVREEAGGVEHHVARFAGKAEDDVSADFEGAAIDGASRGIDERGHIVPSVDEFESAVVS